MSKIQDFLLGIIENCQSVIELKLVIMNLEKIVSRKKLIKNIHHLIARNVLKKDYHTSIEQLFHFCKKISKKHKAQEYLVNKMEMDETTLKQTLTTILNSMKMKA